VQKSDSAFQFFNRQQQKARPSDPALGVAFVVALAVALPLFLPLLLPLFFLITNY